MKYQIISQVITTYQHDIEAESLDEAKALVLDQEDDGIEVDSSPPEIIVTTVLP